MLKRPVAPLPLIERLDAPRPSSVTLPVVSLMVIGAFIRMELLTNDVEKVIVSSPGIVAAKAMTSRSEPEPELAVVVTSKGLTEKTVIVPLVTVRLLMPCVNTVLLPETIPLIEEPDNKVTFPVFVKFCVRIMTPVWGLPIVRFPAVMLFSSSCDNPRFEELSAPPRSTPAPNV